MFHQILDYLREPIVVLSGTPLTALSLLIALAIILIARITAGMAGRSVARAIARRGTDDGVGFAIGKILQWTGTIVGFFVGMSTIGVNMNAVLAASAVLLVGIGFGLQKMAENFVSGLILLVERPVRKGDFVSVGGVLGTVEDIGLRATRVVSRDGITVIVPNGELISATVINHSVPTTTLRIWVRVGVSYGTDLALARRVLLDVAGANARVLDDPAPDVVHEGFNDSSIDLALVVWIARAREDTPIRSELLFAIDAALRANDITIPFPQRDLHLKTVSSEIQTRLAS